MLTVFGWALAEPQMVGMRLWTVEKSLLRLTLNVWGLQVGVVTDIRGRRSTAEAMHLCDKALAATSEAIVITDPNCADNPIVYCNAGFEKLTGGSAGSALASARL